MNHSAVIKKSWICKPVSHSYTSWAAISSVMSVYIFCNHQTHVVPFLYIQYLLNWQTQQISELILCYSSNPTFSWSYCSSHIHLFAHVFCTLFCLELCIVCGLYIKSIYYFLTLFYAQFLLLLLLLQYYCHQYKAHGSIIRQFPIVLT